MPQFNLLTLYSNKNKLITSIVSLQVAIVVKNLPANTGDVRHGSDPWVRKIPERRAWQSSPVFLPGESHVQRSLAG